MKSKFYMMLLIAMSMLLVGSQVACAATNTVTTQNVIVFNEYQHVKDLTQKSPSELKSLGLTEEEINKVPNITQYKEKLAVRSKLSPEELKLLGYSDVQIDIFEDYKGTEDQMQALSSTVVIGEWINSYYYDSSKNKTYADIASNWAWDCCPIFEFWDTVAFSWAGGYIQTADNDVNNYVGVNYKTSGGTTTITHGWDCTPGKGCEADFIMSLDSVGVKWAQSGYTKARIYTDAYTPSLALRAGYGHSELSVSPTVNFDGSGGMTFSPGTTGATTYHVYTL